MERRASAAFWGLHALVLTHLAARGLGRRWTTPIAVFALLVCGAAVYLNHHYVMDVVAGVLLAAATYGIVAWAQAWIRQHESGTTVVGLQQEIHP